MNQYQSMAQGLGTPHQDLYYLQCPDQSGSERFCLKSALQILHSKLQCGLHSLPGGWHAVLGPSPLKRVLLSNSLQMQWWQRRMTSKWFQKRISACVADVKSTASWLQHLMKRKARAHLTIGSLQVAFQSLLLYRFCPSAQVFAMSTAEFVAGWLSGAAGLILGHPIDTVKVRLQTQAGYQNILDCVVRMYRDETVRGFFKGMSFPLLSVAVANSITFGTYSNVLLYLCDTTHCERNFNPPSYGHICVAGCVSGMVQAVILAPVDLIKVRLQNQTHQYSLRGALSKASQSRYRGPVHCAVSIFQEEGVRGMFRGGWALVFRDTPTMAVYFLTYTGLCRGMMEERQEPGPVTVLIAGGFAGTASWVLATPMDVVKARLQMDGVKQAEYRGILDCILASARQEGWRVFLKGLSLNTLRAFPVNAVTFLSYEHLLKMLC